jgi:hypothetical protein
MHLRQLTPTHLFLLLPYMDYIKACSDFILQFLNRLIFLQSFSLLQSIKF